MKKRREKKRWIRFEFNLIARIITTASIRSGKRYFEKKNKEEEEKTWRGVTHQVCQVQNMRAIRVYARRIEVTVRWETSMGNSLDIVGQPTTSRVQICSQICSDHGAIKPRTFIRFFHGFNGKYYSVISNRDVDLLKSVERNFKFSLKIQNSFEGWSVVIIKKNINKFFITEIWNSLNPVHSSPRYHVDIKSISSILRRNIDFLIRRKHNCRSENKRINTRAGRAIQNHREKYSSRVDTLILGLLCYRKMGG